MGIGVLLVAALAVGCNGDAIDNCKLVCELEGADECSSDLDYVAECKADCDFYFVNQTPACWDASQAWYACKLERDDICEPDDACAALSQSSQNQCR